MALHGQVWAGRIVYMYMYVKCVCLQARFWDQFGTLDKAAMTAASTLRRKSNEYILLDDVVNSWLCENVERIPSIRKDQDSSRLF